ncbi:MAG TPA: hypothetical protein VFN25_14260 [Dokdonella sp.]|uniref:hypothetical protein n=1 Tax=Dokdonella sp. TaxID=2291710 RepID=UPI002D806D92|nr:hypothetical protein [Dokdonella sp.]HET9034053.1 hypothetical protein [Dokdonella sp.]
MNARKSTNRNVTTAFAAGALLAALSFNAVAETTVTLDPRAPLAATLLPSVRVSASISNPSAEVRWSIAPGRPIPVTLMPTMTITADVADFAVTTLPTVTVFAQIETPPTQRSPSLAQNDALEPAMLGIAD